MKTGACKCHYLRHACNHVHNERLNSPQARDVLPAALPYSEGDLILLLDQSNVHVNVPDILGECSPRALDGDET